MRSSDLPTIIARFFPAFLVGKQIADPARKINSICGGANAHILSGRRMLNLAPGLDILVPILAKIWRFRELFAQPGRNNDATNNDIPVRS
jgi:hypothetical protein